MPITKGAKKAHSSSLKKRVYNLRRGRTMNESVKKLQKLVAESNATEAESLLPSVFKAIDKAAKRGIIKANTAARKKSRLVASINKVK